MTNREKRKHCQGCHCDVYNHGLGGASQCWSLDSMKIIWRKEVSIDQVPPWKQKAERLPSCYQRQRYIYVGPKQTF